MSDWNPPQTIKLYHGSPSKNVPSILKEGIRFRKVEDVDDTIERGKKLVSDALGVDVKITPQLRENLRMRLTESERSGGVVYLSADKSYAEEQAFATFEWLDGIISYAMRLKYPEVYRRKEKSWDRVARAMKKLKKIDDQRRRLGYGDSDYDEFKRLTIESIKADKEYRVAEAAHSIDSDEEARLKREAREKVYGKDFALFEATVPYSELKAMTPNDMETIERLSREHPEHWQSVLSGRMKEIRVPAIAPNYIKLVETKRGRSTSDWHEKEKML